ncbi:hypothetical protein [Thermus antranikianii]
MEPILLLLALGLVFHLSRAVGIACPSWRLARAEVARLREEVREEEPEVEALLQEAERVLGWKPGKSLGQWLGLCLYFLFWNGNREMAAWRLIHGAERRAVKELCDFQVQARLKRGLGELEELPKEKARIWRRHLESALKEQAEGGAEGRKALLQDFLADLYDARDSRYAQLLTLHNKATYLFWLGLVLVLGILYLWLKEKDQWDGSFHPLFLFLAGLGGGLLSRLIRVVKTARLPTDYGAYWVPLFLSPLLGGLAALLGGFGGEAGADAAGPGGGGCPPFALAFRLRPGGGVGLQREAFPGAFPTCGGLLGAPGEGGGQRCRGCFWRACISGEAFAG